MYYNIYLGSILGCLLIFIFAKHIYKYENGEIKFNLQERINEIQYYEEYDIRWVCFILCMFPLMNTLFLLLVIFKSKIK